MLLRAAEMAWQPEGECGSRIGDKWSGHPVQLECRANQSRSSKCTGAQQNYRRAIAKWLAGGLVSRFRHPAICFAPQCGHQQTMPQFEAMKTSQRFQFLVV